MEENNPVSQNSNDQQELAQLKEEFVGLKSQMNSSLEELKQHLETAASSVTSIDEHKASALKHKNEASSLHGEITKVKGDVDTIKSQIDSLKTESGNAKEEIDSLKSEAEANKLHIDKVKSNSDSQFSSIEEIKKKANDTSEEINELLKGLIEEIEEGEPSKMESLEACYKTVLKNKETIDGILTKINEYETQLFGTKEDETSSLKHRLNEFEKKNNSKYDEWNTNYDTLFKKIEGLLPGATSTGLAKSYEEQGKKHDNPNKNWSYVFIFATAGMITFSVFTFNTPTDFKDAINGILSKIPFFVPAVWLAIYASKQQSRSKRLKEEYAYKETLSKSYESYKREVSALPDSPAKQEMIEKLLQAMVEMMRYNPSETLQSNSHNDKPPIVGDLFGKLKGTKKVVTKAETENMN